MNILIADDHPLFREALTYIVEASFSALDNQICTQIQHTVDYKQTVEVLSTHEIDWLFLDLNMPGSNGLEGLVNIRNSFPDLSIIVISAHESQDIIQSCLSHKVSGYITKSTQPSDIEMAINKILKGERYSPIRINKTLDEKKSLGLEKLTAAQLNILIHIGLGKLNKQIARDLGITEATVKAHITQIYKKLNVNNRIQATLIAQQAKIVE